MDFLRQAGPWTELRILLVTPLLDHPVKMNHPTDARSGPTVRCTQGNCIHHNEFTPD